MVTFLSDKFGSKVNPSYTVKNVEPEQLEISRAGDHLRNYITLKGSSSFQVMVFKPHMKFRASPRMCSCDQCCTDYGSCELFSEYDLTVQELNKVCLRSDFIEDGCIGVDENEQHEQEEEDDFEMSCYQAQS